MSEQLPLPSGTVAPPRFPETRPIDTLMWLQSNDAYNQGTVDFPSVAPGAAAAATAAGAAAAATAAAQNTAAIQSSVQETGEAGECQNTDELDKKLAQFYEEISSTSTTQYRQPPQNHQQHQPPQLQYQSQFSTGGQQSALPSSVDGAGNRSARTYGSVIDGDGGGGGSTVESMSDQLSDLSLGLNEEGKKKVNKVERENPSLIDEMLQ